VNDLVQRVDAVIDTEIDDLIGRYADSYDIAPELRPGGDRHESLRYGAAIEAGLRSFLTEGGFGALTTNFQDLGGLRQLPGLAVQRLMADGRLVGDRRRGRRPGRGIRHRPGQPRQVSTPTGPTRRPTEPTHQPTQTIRARRVP
jgi:L-arabinose isomerase